MKCLVKVACFALCLCLSYGHAWAVDGGLTPPPGSSVSQGVPLGQSRASDSDIFGGDGAGYAHPFLSVGSFYTDNYFNEPDASKEEELTYIFTPGIWLSVPGSKEPLLDVDMNVNSPGGLNVSRLDNVDPGRFQAYFLGFMDISENQRFTEQEMVAYRTEGMLVYRTRGGLSLELFDVLNHERDVYGSGTSILLDKYDKNLFGGSLGYEFTPKLKFRGDYSWHNLGYVHDRNQYRDRDDQTGSAYVFFKALPKTAFFVQYEYTLIQYDQQVQSDSNEHHYYAGVDWDVTEKSRGRLKFGAGQKDYERVSLEDQDDFLVELRTDHQLTGKTGLTFKAVRRSNESDIQGLDSKLSTQVEFALSSQLTKKISALISGYYLNDEYRGSARPLAQRQDDYYNAGIGFGYDLAQWLNASIGYAYTKRNSNMNEYDFDSNFGYFRLSASM